MLVGVRGVDFFRLWSVCIVSNLVSRRLLPFVCFLRMVALYRRLGNLERESDVSLCLFRIGLMRIAFEFVGLPLVGARCWPIYMR